MFTVKFQSRSTDKRGMNVYSPLKSLNLTAFSKTVVDVALAKSSEDVRVSFYIAHEDTVPEGWASKKLEFTTQIWQSNPLTEDEAVLALAELPF